MPTPSEKALARFQVSLSDRRRAHIEPLVTQEVLSTVCVLDDMSVNQMARTTGVHLRTAHNYTSGIHSPNIDKFVRMLDKLGYSLYLVKNGADEAH